MQCLFGGRPNMGHARKQQQSLEEEVQWLHHMLARERRSRQAVAEELRRERAKTAALEQEILKAAQAARDMGESLCCMFLNPCFVVDLLQEPSSQQQLLQEQHVRTAAQSWQTHKEALQRLAQPTQQPTEQVADGQADTGPTATHDQAQHAVPAAPQLSSSSSWTQGVGGSGPHQHPLPRGSPRRSPRRLARSSCGSPSKAAAGALSSRAPAGVSAAKDDVAQAGASEQAPADQGQPQQGSAAASGPEQQQHAAQAAAASQAASPVERAAAPAGSDQQQHRQQQLQPAPSTEATASGSLRRSSSAASQLSVYAAGGRQRSHSSSSWGPAARAGSGGGGSSTGESPAVLAPFGSVLSAEPVNNGLGARCCSSSSSDAANSWARRPGLLLPDTIAPAAASRAAAAEAAGPAPEELVADAGSPRASHMLAAVRPGEPLAAGRAAVQAPQLQGTCASGQPGGNSRRQPAAATAPVDSATRFGPASPAAGAQEGPLAKARPHRYAAAPTARQQRLAVERNSTAQCGTGWPGLSSSAGAITHCRREEQRQELLLAPLTRLHGHPRRVRVGSSSHLSVAGAPPTARSAAAAQMAQRLAPDGRGAGQPLVQQGCLSPLQWHRANLGSTRASFQSVVLGAGASGQDPTAVLQQQLAAFEERESLVVRGAPAAGGDRPSKAARLADAGARKRWLLRLF